MRPREDISEALEVSRVFQLGSDLPSLCLHDWVRVSFAFHSLWLLVARMALSSFLWVGSPFVYSSGWGICFWQRGNLPFLFKKTAQRIPLPTVLIDLLGCWIWSSKLRQEGASYRLLATMPSFKNGIGHTFTKEVDENSCCLHHRDISSFKAQSSSQDNPENHSWEETS